MGVVLHKSLQLQRPQLICSWPGIGNIGILAVNSLINQMGAELFAEIEPWDYFEPRKVTIRNGFLDELVFPASNFYHKKLGEEDLVFFAGDEQPHGDGRMYARGEVALKVANLVLDTVEQYGCRRVYTSGACVSAVHHEMKPRVVAVASSASLLTELKSVPNLVLMSEVSEGSGDGVITGMNGLLLAAAKQRGLEAVCLMGEIPDWLSRTPFPYPRAAGSVVEAFAHILGFEADFELLNRQAEEVDRIINGLYQQFPSDVKELYDQRKSLSQPGPISREEADWMKEHLDDFLKTLSEEQDGGNDDDDRPV